MKENATMQIEITEYFTIKFMDVNGYAQMVVKYKI